MSSEHNGYTTPSPPWSTTSIELAGAQQQRGPARPMSARPVGARPSTSQRPVSAGTSLVLQSRWKGGPACGNTDAVASHDQLAEIGPPEIRRTSDQHLQAAGHAFQSSMGELFEGFCVKLRQDLARDVTEAMGEMHMAMAGKLELKQIAADIKAEVKAESAILRQKLVQSIHQLAGEVRSSSQQHFGQDAGAAEPCIGELGTLSECLAEGLADLRAATRELQAVSTSPSASTSPAFLHMEQELLACAGLGPVLEEVRGRCAHVDANVSVLLQTVRNSSPPAPTRPPAAHSGTAEGPRLDALLEELRQFRIRHDTDFAEVLRASQESRSAVFKELKDMRAQHEADLGNVVSAVRGTWRTHAVDLSPIVSELRQLPPCVHAEVSTALDVIKDRLEASAIREQADRTQFLQAMDDVKRQVAIVANKPEVDFSPVLRAIEDSRHAFDSLQSIKDIRCIVTDIREGKLQMDFSRVLEEVRQTQVHADSGVTAILQAMRDGSLIADFSAVLKAIEASKTEVDFSPVLTAIEDSSRAVDSLESIKEIRRTVTDIREGKLQMDFSSILDEVRQMQVHVDSGVTTILQATRDGSLIADFSTVLKAIEAIKTEVDFSPVLTAIEDGSRAVDSLESIKEIRRTVTDIKEGKLQMNFSSVLEEVRQMQVHVDTGVATILQATRDGSLIADFSAVLKAIEAIKTEVDFSPVMTAIEDSSRAVDSLESIKDIRRTVTDIREGKLEMDFSRVLEEVRQTQVHVDTSSTAILQALRDGSLLPDFAAVLKGKQSGGQIDFSEVLQAVHEVKSQVDFSQVIKEVREHKPEVDFAPVLSEIRDSRTALDTSRSLGDITQIVKDVKEGKIDIDFSPIIKQVLQGLNEKSEVDVSRVLRAIDDSRTCSAFTESIQQIREAVSEVRKGKIDIDFSPIAQEVRQMQSQLETRITAIFSVLKEGKLAIDASVMKAVDTIKAEVDFSPVIKEVREVKSKMDFSQVCRLVQEHKPDIDFSPVLKAVQDSRTALENSRSICEIRDTLKAVRNCQLESDHTPIIRELELLRSHMDTCRATVKAMSEGKIVVDCPAIMTAIAKIKTEVDFTTVLQAIHKLKGQMDSSNIIMAIQDLKSNLDTASLAKGIDDLRTTLDNSLDIKEIKNLVKEVRSCQSEADCSPAIKEILQIQSRIDNCMSSVLKSIEDGKIVVDTSAVTKAIEAVKTEVDFSQILQAINKIKNQVDFSQVLKAIQEHKPSVDLMPVLKAISDSRAALDVSHSLREIKQVVNEVREGRTEIDYSPVIREIKKMQSQVDASTSAILKSLVDGNITIDSSAVVKAIEAVKTEVDFSQVLQAIQKAKSQVDFSQVLNAIQEHKPEVNISPILKAINDSRTALDFSHGIREIRQALMDIRDGHRDVEFPRLRKDVEDVKSQINAGLSTTVKALSEDKSTADQSALAKMIEASKTEVLKTIREKTLEVDFSTILKAIDDCRDTLDLSLIIKNMSKDVNELRQAVHKIDPWHVVKEVQLMKSHIDAGLSTILTTMKSGSVATDNSAVMKAIEVIHTQVLKAIAEKTLDVDFSAVLKAIDDGRNALDALKIDFSPVMKEFQLIKVQADVGFSTILTTMKEGGVAVDNSAVVKAIETIGMEVNALQDLQASHKRMPEVDLSPILQAISDSRTALDFTQSIEEVKRDLRDVRRGKVGMDLPVVVKEIQKMQTHFDTRLSTVLEAIREHKPEMDLSPALEAINDSRTALLVTLKEGNVAVDLSGVMAAIGAARMEVLKAIQEHRPNVDLTSVLQAITNTRLALDSSEDIRGLHRKVHADFAEVTKSIEAIRAEVCAAIREHKPDVDLSPVITAINSSRAAPDPLQQHGHQAPLMREVHQVQSQLDAGLSEVLKLMRGGTLAVDLSPVMKALGESLAVPSVLHGLEEIRQTVNEFRERKLTADQSLLTSEVQQIHSHIDSGIATIVKDMHEDKMASECFSEMMAKAVSVSKDEVIQAVKNQQVDFRPVLQAVRDANMSAELTQNLEELRVVLSDLRRGPLSQELPQVLEDVRQLLLQAEHNRSVAFRSLDDARADSLHGEPCAELEAPEEEAKIDVKEIEAAATQQEAGRRRPPPGDSSPAWHGASVEVGGGKQQQDFRRRPASAPPRSAPWRGEAEQSREESIEDPELAFAESLAVRAQHLADAAAEAQCRAEAIEAAEAVLVELPLEASVQSLGTEGWLPPIPEEPDPEAQAQQMVQSMCWKLLDGPG